MKCSQNNKPKQGKTYREMGKEHKLANLPQNSNDQHIPEKCSAWKRKIQSNTMRNHSHITDW